MEEVKVRKNNNINFVSIIIIMLVFGVLLGAGGSYYYFEILNSDKEDKVEDKEDVVEEVKLSPDSLLAQSLLDKYNNTAYPMASVNYYLDDYFEIDKLSDQSKYELVFSQFFIPNYGYAPIVMLNDFEKTYNNLFGLESEYLEYKNYCLYSCENDTLLYTFELDKFIFNDKAIYGFHAYDYIISKVYDTRYLDNGDLILNVAAGIKLFIDGETDYVINFDSDTLKYESNGRYTSEINLSNGNDDPFDIDEDFDLLTKYEFMYVYDEVQGYYYLDNITKIK